MRRLSLLCLLLPACAHPSIAIHTDDPVFARGQARLAASTASVDALHPSPEERTLFLQAEAFHDYRFSFPKRSPLGYLAEGAAAVTDFPALQTFASSLDLADLRITADDGAIHLWESLLEQHPATPLRALTLWRLGWAYRNTGVRGFPHGSRGALDLLRRENPDTPLAAFATEAQAVPWKSKTRAGSMSILPGLGQLYEGRTANGAIRFAVGLGSAALMLAPAVDGYRRRSELRWDRDWPLLAAGSAGAIVLSIDFTSSYQDATRGAVRFNEEREAAFFAAHPDAP